MNDPYAHRGEIYQITSSVTAWHDGNLTPFREIPRGFYIELWRDAGHAVLTDLVKLLPIDSRVGSFGIPTGGRVETAALDHVIRCHTGSLMVPFGLNREQFELVADALRLATCRINQSHAEAGAMLCMICAEYLQNHRHEKGAK